MASKNIMKNMITIFLNINLVFFGLTVAHAPAPHAGGCGCPRDLVQVQACTEVLSTGPYLYGTKITFPCCILVAGLSPIVASVCFCNAIEPRILDMTVNINVRLNQLLQFCGVPTPTPDAFRCAQSSHKTK